MIKTLAAAAAFTIGTVGAASAATVVFFETFDDEAATLGTSLNFEGGDVFDVKNGTVDLISSGDFGIDCEGSAGGCVDLNGSTGDAGLLFTDLTFEDGVQYELSFSLSGNQVNDFDDTVVFGAMGLETSKVSVQSDAAFTTYTLTFTGTGATNTLFFKNGGPDGDNIGAILDNVRLVAGVPVPAAGLLLLTALGGIGFARRRKAA